MRFVRSLLVLAVLIAICLASAAGPAEGLYVFRQKPQEGVQVVIELTLKKTKTAAFDVRGTWKKFDTVKQRVLITRLITGTLQGSGVLKANLTVDTNKNDASFVDGEWNEEECGINLRSVGYTIIPNGSVAKLITYAGTWEGDRGVPGTIEFKQVGKTVTGEGSGRLKGTWKGTLTVPVIEGTQLHIVRTNGARTYTGVLVMENGGKAIRCLLRYKDDSGEDQSMGIDFRKIKNGTPVPGEGQPEKPAVGGGDKPKVEEKPKPKVEEKPKVEDKKASEKVVVPKGSVLYGGEFEVPLEGKGDDFHFGHQLMLYVAPATSKGESEMQGKVRPIWGEGYKIDLRGNVKGGKLRAAGEMLKDGGEYDEGVFVITLDGVYSEAKKGYDCVLVIKRSDKPVNVTAKLFIKKAG